MEKQARARTAAVLVVFVQAYQMMCWLKSSVELLIANISLDLKVFANVGTI
jgi:hypothetical protein